MDRYGVNDGTQAEILAELEQITVDRAGSPDRVALYRAAIEKIQAGADTVRVGDQVWRVTDWAEL